MNDDDRCPATNRNGEPCGHPAGWGTDSDEGPCKHHGGAGGDVGDPGGAPEGNSNAVETAAFANLEKFRMEETLDAETVDRIESADIESERGALIQDAIRELWAKHLATDDEDFAREARKWLELLDDDNDESTGLSVDGDGWSIEYSE